MNCLVYTETNQIIEYCASIGVDTSIIPKKNEYNIPILKDMVLTARQRYNCEYVIYINSDILINPNVFKSIYYLESILGRNVFSNDIIITRCFMAPVYIKLIFHY